MSANHHFYQRICVVPPAYYLEGISCFVFASPAPGRLPLNRFYHPASGAHYYTIHPETPQGWVAEGSEGFVLQNHDPKLASIPFFRFYNPSSDDHFYQTNPQIPKSYVSEGSEGEVIATLTNGRVPLYRFYSGSKNKHFYTTISSEAPKDYVLEGVTGFVFNTAAPDRARLFRFYNPSSGGHYYSLDGTVPGGYVLENEPIFVQKLPIGGETTPLFRFYSAKFDDHFYDNSPTVPGLYVSEPSQGFIFKDGGNGMVPLYSFFNPQQDSAAVSFGKALLNDVVAGTLGPIIGGPIGLAAGLAFSDEVAKGVAALGRFTLTGGGSMIGLALAGATLVLGGEYAAMVAFVAATVVGNLIIRQRRMTDSEHSYVRCIFADKLPVDRIMLTNLKGIGGRFFTLPAVVGSDIYVNIGEAYDNPLNYLGANETRKGQVFIHELTHAWQIAHSTFKPGFVCEGILEQTEHTLGKDVYGLSDSDKTASWSSFTNEQQAHIVERWYAEGCSPTSGWGHFVQIVNGGATLSPCP